MRGLFSFFLSVSSRTSSPPTPARGAKSGEGDDSTHSNVVESPLEAWMRISSECGKRTVASRRSLRIVGGQEARRGGWPWVVRIYSLSISLYFAMSVQCTMYILYTLQ